MSETDPEAARRRQTAGEVGVHRQDIAEPVHEAGDSVNVARQRGRTATRTRPRSADVPGRAGVPDVTGETDERAAQDVRRDIARTRAELGETVDAIAARADVRTRVRRRVEEVRNMARTRAAGVKERTAGVKERAADVRERTGRVTGRVREATPEQVREAAGTVTRQAKRSPAATIAIGCAVLLALRRLLRRRR
jgi:ElaB/YqjD/DUF883 family membrane-anchored ribosome-binding protein